MIDQRELAHGRPPLADTASPNPLRQRWLLIVLTAIAGVLLAGLYLAAVGPVYTATASILLDPAPAQTANAGDKVSTSAAIESRIALLRSDAVLQAVFKSQGLGEDPEFADASPLTRLRALVRRQALTRDDDAYDRFTRHVSVDRRGASNVVDIVVALDDPEKAAAVANAIVARYRADRDAERKAAEKAIDDRIAGLRRRADDTARAVRDFENAHHLSERTADDALRSEIGRLTARLGSADDRAAQADGKYRQATGAGRTPKGFHRLADLMPSPTAERLRQQYDRRAAAFANAQKIYGDRYPAIIELKEELRQTRDRMASEADRIVQRLKTARDRAQQEVAGLKKRLAGLRDRADKDDLERAKLGQLQGEAASARAALDDFLKGTSGAASVPEEAGVSVVNSARPPASPTWPRAALLLPAGLVAGLLAGCLIALLAGPKRRRMASEAGLPAPADAVRETQPVPSLPPASPRDASPALARLGTCVLPPHSGNTARSAIKAIRSQLQETASSPLSLAVLKLLGQVIGQIDQHDEPFVLLVSSIDRGVERKLAAALIGLGLQRLEEKVLIVEIVDGGDEPLPLRSVSARRGTGVFTDHASGLPTIVVAENDLRASGRPASDTVLAKAGGDFDFLVVVGHPVRHAGYGAGFEDDADLTIFALSAAEDESGADNWLADRLRDEGLDGKTAIVLRQAESDGKCRSAIAHLVGADPKADDPLAGEG